jgi:hypothetical protein
MNLGIRPSVNGLLGGQMSEEGSRKLIFVKKLSLEADKPQVG